MLPRPLVQGDDILNAGRGRFLVGLKATFDKLCNLQIPNMAFEKSLNGDLVGRVQDGPKPSLSTQ